MKLLGALVFAVSAGAVLCPASAQARPAQASPVPAQCFSADGSDVAVQHGKTACGAESDRGGSSATAYGIGGVGYAKANSGARAIALGVAGGTGASAGLGVGGVPVALGFGPGSVAITYVHNGSMAVALAAGGSQALVKDNDTPDVRCDGSAALALDLRSGRACLATVLGSWSVG